MPLNSILKLQIFQKCIKTQFENLMKLSSSCLNLDQIFHQLYYTFTNLHYSFFESISSADTSSFNI